MSSEPLNGIDQDFLSHMVAAHRGTPSFCSSFKQRTDLNTAQTLFYSTAAVFIALIIDTHFDTQKDSTLHTFERQIYFYLVLLNVICEARETEVNLSNLNKRILLFPRIRFL